MQRSKLKEIIAECADAVGIWGDNRARLVNAADLTDRIAVGSFALKAEKCGCPATVAGFWVQRGLLGEWAADAPEGIDAFTQEFDTHPEISAERRVGISDYARYIQITDTPDGGISDYSRYIQITDTPEAPAKASFGVETKHPSGTSLNEGDPKWIVRVPYEATDAEDAARQRLEALGNCPENTPVLLRAAEKDSEEFSYYLGVIPVVGERTLTAVV